MSNLSTPLYKLATAASGLFNFFFGQTISAAQHNAMFAHTRFMWTRALMSIGSCSVGYDVSNDFFISWLSKEMMYSNALFGPEEGGPRGDKITGPIMGQLEAAQLRKLHHVLTKARVKPGDRVLEFGTGWGGCAIEVRDDLNCIECPSPFAFFQWARSTMFLSS
jgi:cyclopropane-fatty-acyl-phospholipid synthase